MQLKILRLIQKFYTNGWMLFELNSKLLNESSKPFHSYLLISGSSRYLIDQAKAFSSNLLFNSNDILQHPDIRVVSSENINTLGVDDIRRVINDESIYPIEGKYKIFIFPPTKSLTEEASNALLKTLEEPSKSNIFIITSNGRHWSHSKDDSIKNILPTLKSRCRTLYIDDEYTYTYNFEFDDIVNFLDTEENLSLKNLHDEIKLITSTLQNLNSPNQDSNEKIFNFIKLENAINKLDSDSNRNLNIFERSIEYLVNSILSSKNFTKVEFRYAEILSNLIEDISSGIRPKIAFNKLVLESETF